MGAIRKDIQNEHVSWIDDDWSWVFHTIPNATVRQKFAEFWYDLEKWSQEHAIRPRWLPVESTHYCVRFTTYFDPSGADVMRRVPDNLDWMIFAEFAELNGLYAHKRWRGVVSYKRGLKDFPKT